MCRVRAKGLFRINSTGFITDTATRRITRRLVDIRVQSVTLVPAA